MSTIKVTKIHQLNAEFEVPGDKSISHRTAILAGLGEGTTKVENFLPSEDCLCTLNAMASFGVHYDILDEMEGFGPTSLVIHGTSMKLSAPKGEVDCGNSGTGMRLLAGMLSAQPFETILTGDASLSSRPMGRIMTPLLKMGGSIDALGEAEGCAPLRLGGRVGELKPISYQMPVASAQVKSAILLAGLFAEGETSVTQPKITRDHTERIFAHFGIDSSSANNVITVSGGQTPKARDLRVPGDISSAAFWLVAAAAVPGANLRINNVGLNPTRTAILDVLIRMGAQITITPVGDQSGEPCGDIEVTGGELVGTEILPDEVPNLIDEIPVLAVAGALAKGRMLIRNAKELRVKESDRVTTVVDNLLAMGAEVEEFVDGMEINGGQPLHAAEMQSHGDHRIAMAFAIAALFAEGESSIINTDCINTSYPGFSLHLEAVLGAQ